MNSRTRFLLACERKPLDRPPIWIMRQAGRYLPEYRQLKEKHGFLKLVQTPELAAEVTLQPLRRFKLDAAILFCDILVIPEAMGQPYRFRDGGGIEMEYKLDSKEKVERLTSHSVADQLQYVANAIQLVRKDLGQEKAIIGFGGSPWTLATYMVEGGSSKDFAGIKNLFYTDYQLFNHLLEKITNALISYFEMQIDAGVDVIQIFDSWAGILTPHTYWDASAKYIHRIIQKIGDRIPIIVFAKGAHHWKDELIKTEAPVLGLDWTYPIAKFHDDLQGRVAVQGNLDPVLLNTTPEVVIRETQTLLQSMKGRPGYIFNLGHGILPQAKLECFEALVDTVIHFDKSK
ncbi:MAG: uroporphyrinogen decarboxylase [Candidatus Marinimicrobia bacterium]|nr:uroporphyrinogen decarboxylase [Candidatus Neomarinimicrobiota bacterium]